MPVNNADTIDEGVRSEFCLNLKSKRRKSSLDKHDIAIMVMLSTYSESARSILFWKQKFFSRESY